MENSRLDEIQFVLLAVHEMMAKGLVLLDARPMTAAERLRATSMANVAEDTGCASWCLELVELGCRDGMMVGRNHSIFGARNRQGGSVLAQYLKVH